jgi:threonine dehydratase
MSVLSQESIVAARKLLARYLELPTSLRAAPSLSRLSRADVHLKLECELPTGSFKVRGALVALSSMLDRKRIKEVVTSSTGNHGAAVAWAASLLGMPCTVYLPVDANPVKRSCIEKLGARVVESGRDLATAEGEARQYVLGKQGLYYLHDPSDPVLPMGPATIASEILEQLPQADTIVVPVGDTALIRGIATTVRWVKPEVTVVGVQAKGAPAYYLSWKAGYVVPAPSAETIADGLASSVPLFTNVQQIKRLVDEFCLVSDEEMLNAMRVLRLQEGVLSEPAGAAAAAALLSGKAGRVGARTVLLVSGANSSPDLGGKGHCGEGYVRHVETSSEPV